MLGWANEREIIMKVLNMYSEWLVRVYKIWEMG